MYIYIEPACKRRNCTAENCVGFVYYRICIIPLVNRALKQYRQRAQINSGCNSFVANSIPQSFSHATLREHLGTEPKCSLHVSQGVWQEIKGCSSCLWVLVDRYNIPHSWKRAVCHRPPVDSSSRHRLEESYSEAMALI